MAVGLEELLVFYQPAQVLYLCPIGGDDADIQPLVEDTGLADLLEVLLQGQQGQLCLCLVDATETLTDKGLLERDITVLGKFKLRGVDPGHGNVEVEDAAVFHFRRTLHLIAIEPVGGEAHDLLVHTVLHLQQGHHLGLVLYDPLHQCFAESRLQGGKTLYGRGQLTMVARQDDA